MNLIDKVEIPKEDNKLIVYYNPNYTKIEKDVGGVLMSVDKNVSYIEKYTTKGDLLVYDFKGKEFQMPLSKVDYILSDLVAYRVKYIRFMYNIMFHTAYAWIDYLEDIVFFKRDDQIELVEDFKLTDGEINYSDKRCHYHNFSEKKHTLAQYDLTLIKDKNDEIVVEKELYRPELLKLYTKDLNIKTLIDKI